LYTHGSAVHKKNAEVLLREDLDSYLTKAYPALTDTEKETIIRQFENVSSGDLYAANKKIHQWIAEGFPFKREDPAKKDLFIRLIDTEENDTNIYRIVNQLEITGTVRRIPDIILYINGLPLVIFELKTPVKEYVTLEDAYKQLTIRYRRDISELLKYHALLIISDGVNSKYGTLFTPYEHYYTWRRKNAGEKEAAGGFDTLFTLLEGLLNKNTLKKVITDYIYFPDQSAEQKLICRYPQYLAAEALYQNIRHHLKPEGDGKGGTYFGATGCGKSYTMLFLSRLLMKDPALKSPTILLITDRTDLDDQLSGKFTNAKSYLRDDTVRNITSREKLREELRNRPSGGVFLTTVQKFAESTSLLSERTNIICISDEAHRSQLNLDITVRENEKGELLQTAGFAKLLRDALPNATYVGFTGTPIDETMEVFGDVVDAYTMQQSVEDGITVNIVYEGRAARVLLDSGKIHDIENYYKYCISEGSSEYEVDLSKKATANMEAVLGDPDRLQAVAKDFIHHYEARIKDKATVKGKAMFICASRKIAWDLYRILKEMRPDWTEPKISENPADKEKVPAARLNLVMTRTKDDDAELYALLGDGDFRKTLDTLFKDDDSNFKIAIVVDMWITGFDVPSLDTMYIDKQIQNHTLIQTISRVNRVFEGKENGLVVDYIGIKKKMDAALGHYSDGKYNGFRDTEQFVKIVKDDLEILAGIFHKFNANLYFNGNPVEKIRGLNAAVEFVQGTEEREKQFMGTARHLKRAYTLCAASDSFTTKERELVHFYTGIRGVILKLNKGDVPDITQMNNTVQRMIEEAIISDGVEELFSNSRGGSLKVDIFSEEYLKKISRLRLPNTKIKILEQLLKRLIGEYRKVNKIKAVDFTERMNAIVDRYNDRSEEDLKIQEEVTEKMMKVIQDVINARNHHKELGITFEEEAFYDILKQNTIKYKFAYPEEKLLSLAKKVKELVDDKAKYTDWAVQENIKAELKSDLRILLDENDYPPVPREDVFAEVLEQAENFKRYQ
ncbi:MAG TPA: type I restriction endonuclease subunit R, partial [Methanocorpusculum sp.]|nr:type I restriction endonuclease subunit R [Methanocorpusculum sp.]